jgi:hypothetical protein
MPVNSGMVSDGHVTDDTDVTIEVRVKIPNREPIATLAIWGR